MNINTDANFLFLQESDNLNNSWKNALFPLGNSFYFPKPIFFSFQLLQSDFLEKYSTEAVFLKDGILGLMPLFSELITNKKRMNFYLPISLAPTIPQKLKDHFLFYRFKEINEKKDFSKIVLFLGVMEPFTSVELLKETLLTYKGKIKEIKIIRQRINEGAYKIINDQPITLTTFFEEIAFIKEIFPDSIIEYITADQFTYNLPLDEYLFINTNHYNYFCSLDYLSYVYYFRTGRTGINFSSHLLKNFVFKSEINLVRGLKMEVFGYEGMSLFNDSSCTLLEGLDHRNISINAKNVEYLSPFIQNLSKNIAFELFNFNKTPNNAS